MRSAPMNGWSTSLDGRHRSGLRRAARTGAATLLISTCASAPISTVAQPSAQRGADRPNIILILTDDQRFDSLFAMPQVQQDLVAHGVRFTNAIVSNSLCCPSRATILTGGYSHTTKVYSNVYVPWSPYGAWPVFKAAGDERGTIALALDRFGYRTALIGKYLNEFAGPRAPPGWDRFTAFIGGHDGAAYYDYSMFVKNATGSHTESFGSEPRDYSTSVIDRKALAFLRSTPTEQPFFLYVAPFAPHAKVVPAPRDRGTWSDHYQALRPNFNEADVSDKPAYIRQGPMLPEAAARTKFELQDEALQAVDRMVGHIVDELRGSGRLHDTMLIFMSDNGIENGEHRWIYKLTPYEESIRVPLVVRYDPLTGANAGAVASGLVSNADIAPTIADVIDLRFAGTGTVDGVSFAPLLTTGSWLRRPPVLLEHLDYPGKYHVPTYCGLRTANWTYVRYSAGVEELYHLTDDPYELTNVAGTANAQLRRLRHRTHTLCSPLPPEYTWP
jgi:N-acetylglucosamine-6-sulfatase